MALYTGYFAGLKRYGENVLPIAICRYIPKWYSGIHFGMVAPKPSILKNYKDGFFTEEDYEILYRQQLSLLNFQKDFLLPLKKVLDNDNRNVVFLCYERTGEFCHRHIFSQWINEHIPNLCKGELV